MNIIVTGSDGWIGKHVCQQLDQLDIGYYGFDRKTNYDLISPEGRREFQFALTDVDAVIHLAARPRIPLSWGSTSAYIKDNIELTEYVAQMCATFGVHLVFASSSSVYGDGAGPLNPYSWTKQSGEQIIEAYSRSMDLNYTICRIFTCYGEDAPYGDKGLVIGNWLHSSLNGKPILLRGGGQQRRDFVHVDDVADALIRTAGYKPKNVTLDLGTGQNWSLEELAPLFNCPIVTEQELLGYAKDTCANTTQAKELLGWSATRLIPDWIKTLDLNRPSTQDG
jgi:UDP-glucose 4-epimerase